MSFIKSQYTGVRTPGVLCGVAGVRTPGVLCGVAGVDGASLWFYLYEAVVLSLSPCGHWAGALLSACAFHHALVFFMQKLCRRCIQSSDYSRFIFLFWEVEQKHVEKMEAHLLYL